MKSITSRPGGVPPVVVVLGVALVVAGLGVARLFGVSEVDARVVEEHEVRRRKLRATFETASPTRDPEELPAYREAYRVQETSGLVLGLSLVAVEHRLTSGAPVRDVGALVEAARARGILPPRTEIAGAGALASPHSVLYVRYRPHPVGVEVVSIPKTSIAFDGPPLLARVTAETGAEFFTLLREATPVEVPLPFQSAALLEATRWKRESLRDLGDESGKTDDLLKLAQVIRR